MDTHILTAPGTLGLPAQKRHQKACLPGEGAPPLAAGPDERSRASVPSRRCRGARTTTSCIVVVALAAGGSFSDPSSQPHRPDPHGALAIRWSARSKRLVGFSPEGPLAPAATLATAPLPATGRPPVRQAGLLRTRRRCRLGSSSRTARPIRRSRERPSNRFRQRRPHRCRLPRRTPGARPALCLRCTRSGFRHRRLRRHRRSGRATIRSARAARKRLQWLPLRPRARRQRHRQVPSQRGFRGASRLIRRHLLWRRLNHPPRMRSAPRH